MLHAILIGEGEIRSQHIGLEGIHVLVISLYHIMPVDHSYFKVYNNSGGLKMRKKRTWIVKALIAIPLGAAIFVGIAVLRAILDIFGVLPSPPQQWDVAISVILVPVSYAIGYGIVWIVPRWWRVILSQPV
jgi:uncharacterized membrane-anchored protein YitT (DUF2179 family)